MGVQFYCILKHLILSVLFLSSFSGFCQNGSLPLDASKNVSYSDLGNLSKSKEQIYADAQKWVSKTFGNYENAVTLEEPQTGKLMINSYIPVAHSRYEHIRFDLTINCTDQHFDVKIDKLDGIATMYQPTRIGVKENDLILAKEMALKTEPNRKKRTIAEESLQRSKSDNDAINKAMYDLLANLKGFLVAESGH